MENKELKELSEMSDGQQGGITAKEAIEASKKAERELKIIDALNRQIFLSSGKGCHSTGGEIKNIFGLDCQFIIKSFENRGFSVEFTTRYEHDVMIGSIVIKW